MNDIFDILKTLLKASNYTCDEFELQKQLLSDPDQGILPITNTLDFFNIKHITANVPKSALAQLPEQFMAQVTNGKSERITLVSKTNNGKYIIKLNDQKKLSLTESEFINDWTGLVIAVEQNNDTAKTTLTKQQQLNIGVLSIVVLLICYVALTIKSYGLISYFALSLCGLGLANLIVREKFGKQTLASKFCNISSTTSCENVISSKSAMVFKNIDLSDSVVIYFLFTCFTFLLIPRSSIFLIIAICSVPVVIYSIYQQYFIIKKWCPLCLGVAGILLLQFIILLNSLKIFGLEYKDVLIATTLFAIIALVWLSIKSLIAVKKNSKTLVIENLSFRRNHNLFLPYYNSLNQIDTYNETIKDIKLGSKNPELTIIAITNPLCATCFEAHRTYMKILKEHSDKVQICLRFLVPYHNRNDPQTQISERLLEIYNNENNSFIQAFTEWYAKISVKQWLGKWKECENKKFNDLIGIHNKWCSTNKIESTPTILINGKLFPKFYRPSDIEFFVEKVFELIQLRDSEKVKNIHA